MPSLLSRIISAATGRRHMPPAPSSPPPRGRTRTASIPVPPRRNFVWDDSSTWTYPPIAVSSSNIAAVAYDYDGRVLEIRFAEASANHSDTYRYTDVPLAIYQGLMAAASKGVYHWDYIRGKFTYGDVG